MDVPRVDIPIVSDLCKWIDDTAVRRQPWVTMAHVLPFLGTVLGRKVALGNLRTNLYCLNVAPAGSGKGHAAGRIRDLCLKCQCENLIGSYDVASDTAIEKTLIKNPSLVCYWDEISFMFGSIRNAKARYVAKIRPMLMQLYSQADTFVRGKARAMDEETPTLVYPCFSFCGSATPQEFCDNLSLRELTDGWWSRCLLFWSSEIPQKQERKDVDIPSPLVDWTTHWLARGEDEEIQILSGSNQTMIYPKLLSASMETRAHWYFRAIEKIARQKYEDDDWLHPLWIRAEENAKRIALIFSACEFPNEPKITANAARIACEIVYRAIRDFEKYVARLVQPESDREVQRVILQAIQDCKNPTGCYWSNIVEATRFTVNRNRRKQAVQELIDSGTLIMKMNSATKQMQYIIRK